MDFFPSLTEEHVNTISFLGLDGKRPGSFGGLAAHKGAQWCFKWFRNLTKDNRQKWLG